MTSWYTVNMLKNKLQNFGLPHVLILFAVLILVSAVFVVQDSASSRVGEFQQDAASQDTTPFSEYAKGEVTEVLSEQIDEAQSSSYISQQLTVKLTNTDKAGETVTVDNAALLDQAGSAKYGVGDKVVLGTISSNGSAGSEQYVIIDRYRLPSVAILVSVFLLLAIAVGRWRGLTSLIGLGITGCILLS